MIDALASSPDPYPTYARLRAHGVCRLDDGRWVVAREADIDALLAETTAIVPPVAPHDRVRATMARFSEGEEHRRRRAIAVAALAALGPTSLRRRARAATIAALDRDGDTEVDLMDRVARHVPVAALAEAIGIGDSDAAVSATRRLCRALAPPLGVAAGDAAEPLGDLRRMLEPVLGRRVDAEAVVNVAALLFQAADATAGLIGNAVVARARRGGDSAGADPTDPAADLVADTLALDPPVHLTTRITARPLRLAGCALDAGEVVVVLLGAPGRGPRPENALRAFGGGRHRCPGRPQAIALATGVIDGLGAVSSPLTGGAIAYEPRSNLRIPTRLIVRRP